MGSQGHTQTECRTPVGTLSPIPSGLLCPKLTFSPRIPCRGGDKQDFVPRAGSRSHPSAYPLVSPGEGPGNRGRLAERLHVGDQPLFSHLPVAHTLWLSTNVGVESY